MTSYQCSTVTVGCKFNPSEFWAKVSVSQDTDCWPWVGRRNKTGYGATDTGNRSIRSHRVAWLLCHGDIPKGYGVLHTCDNPSCCNPAHLFVGSPADNARDRRKKGRSATGDKHGSKTMPWTVPKLRGATNPSSKLTENEVVEIRDLYTRGYRQVEIAQMFPVTCSAIRLIVTGQKWKYLLSGDTT